ncbi:cuticle protein 6-like [Limulus polyphemus]|uniref:Cuticle protein 6-like n=1 Tax=Limulus polyphemus TaxID=6850 RepID=A0ABM1S4N6_LIMPO|nr:cuticle protein 6-like [Limulus polyphemus]
MNQLKILSISVVIFVLTSIVGSSKTDAEKEDNIAAATGYGGGGGNGLVRTQFHEQGIQGPHSYRFGYDTADLYNPQSRYEERDGYGNVIGYYSYVDPYGKLQIVEYQAHPKFGFRAKGSFGVFPRGGH